MLHLHTQSGRSMIEMLGVLAIIGVISIGAIAGMNQAMVKYRTSRTYSDILAISQNVADFYSYKRSYADDQMMARLCDSREKIFPSSCSGTTATNAFGGTFLVSPVDGEYEGEESTRFNIQASNIPVGPCNELKGLNWGKYVVGTPECTGGDAVTKTFSITFE